jgi:hypothetical protein
MPQGRVAVVVSPGKPAAWVFVVGRGFVAAVPVETCADVLERLTERVLDRRVDLESLVALLPLTGPDALSSFFVVVQREATDADGIPVSAIVRGTAVADVFSIGGSRRFSDRGIRPWLLADFRAVTGLVIGSIDAPVLAAGGLGAGQRVGTGASTGSALFWSILGAPNTDPDVQVEPDVQVDLGRVATGSLSSGVANDVPPAFPPAAPPDLGSEYDTEIRVPRAVADGDTVLRVSRDHWPGSERPESPPPDGDTIIRPPRPARYDQRAGSGPADLEQAWGVHNLDAQHTHEHDHELARPLVDPAGDGIARYAFQLVPGEAHRLDRAYVLGRNPRLPRIVRGEPPQLLTVASPTSAVSSTHLEIRQEGHSIVVTDLGSTNGTVVRPPRGRTRRLRSGQSLSVMPGTVVDIGDGNIVEILR